MEPELLPKFVEEGQSTLAGVRACILTAIRGNGGAAELDGSIGLIRSFRSTALMFPGEEFHGSLTELEMQLSAAALSRGGLAAGAGLKLLDQLAAMEASLGMQMLTAPDPHFDVSRFVDESFESLRTLPLRESVIELSDEVVESTPEVDEFEIDDEMLEVFTMEAEDLLANIESSLGSLSTQPDNRDALWEIRRSAHTFKGAAGIVGLRRQSELAHRIEDLLDSFADNDAASIDNILVVLRTATDLLRAMTAGEEPDRLSAEFERINTDFDNILRSLRSEEALVRGASLVAAPPSAQLADETAAPAMAAPSNEPRPDRKPIIRVSLERLDDLVINVRDMVVGRSVLERLLSELERQINELHNSTRRLQSTCSRFEIDVESSIFLSCAADAQYDPSKAGSKGFDPLELDRYTGFHQGTRQLSETASDAFSIGTALESVRNSLEILFDDQQRLTDQMQGRLMKIRMVEFGSLTTRLQRAVRVTCEEEGKHAEIVIENGQLEIDTQILDALVEPLIHLLKNAVVHGIEDPETRRLIGKPQTGRIVIRLVGEETHIVVAVSDDGRGIAASALCAKAVSSGQITNFEAGELTEEERLGLIFLPGLTTAEKLNLSAGRGVGMSIVKESIEAKKGTISLKSTPQRGTTFTLRLPLPLAVTNVVIVRAGQGVFAVPTKLIDRIEKMPHSGGDPSSVTFSGRTYEFRMLGEIAGSPIDERPDRNDLHLLLIDTIKSGIALAVNEVVRSEEVVIEALRQPLDSIPGLLGAAIIGSGELVPILDLPALLKSDAVDTPKRPVVSEKDPDTFILVVDDSPSVRQTTSKVLQNAGWSVETAKDGLDALEKLGSSPRLPAVILSDVEMPRMDGYEFISTVKESAQLKTIPVIFITSRSGEKHREKANALGVSNYLAKPFDEKELLRLVSKLGGFAARR